MSFAGSKIRGQNCPDPCPGRHDRADLARTAGHPPRPRPGGRPTAEAGRARHLPWPAPVGGRFRVADRRAGPGGSVVLGRRRGGARSRRCDLGWSSRCCFLTGARPPHPTSSGASGTCPVTALAREPTQAAVTLALAPTILTERGQPRRSPARLGGATRVGKFSEQVWPVSPERHHYSAEQVGLEIVVTDLSSLSAVEVHIVAVTRFAQRPLPSRRWGRFGGCEL